MIVTPFALLVDKREKLVEEHYGQNLKQMLEYPEERKWYVDHVFQLDDQLIRIGNNVLKHFGIKEKAKNLNEIYSNKTLIDYYKKQKEQLCIKPDRKFKNQVRNKICEK